MSADRFLKPADFGRLCGIPGKTPGVKITTYIGRGILKADKATGLLDIRNIKNKNFIAKCLSEKAAKEESGVKPTKRTRDKSSDEPVDSGFNFTFTEDGSVDVNSLKAYSYSLTDIKTIEDIRLKQVNIRLKNIEEAKLMGKMIDSDFASEALLVFAQTFMRMMSDHLNGWIMDFSHRNKLPNTELGRLTGEAKVYINKSYDDALYSAEEKMEQARKETVKNATVKNATEEKHNDEE